MRSDRFSQERSLVGSEGCAPIGLLRGGRGPGDHCGPDDLVRGADEHVRGPDDGQHGRVRWRHLSVRAAYQQQARDFEKATLGVSLRDSGNSRGGWNAETAGFDWNGRWVLWSDMSKCRRESAVDVVRQSR